VFVAKIIYPLAQKRIKDYSSTGVELNDDQKRSITTLPGLEAVVKELEEVKKAIEVGRPFYYLRFLKRSTMTHATES